MRSSGSPVPLHAAAQIELVDVDLVLFRAAQQVLQKSAGLRIVGLAQEQRAVAVRVLLEQQRVLLEERTRAASASRSTARGCGG